MIRAPYDPERTPPTYRERHTSRTANDVASIRESFLENLFFVQARFPEVATRNDYYLALAWTVRDRLLRRWVDTAATYYRQASRSLCFLSAEYLPGPHLGNAILSLDIEQPVREALDGLGLDLNELCAQEPEPGLGNGGLGRLAACFVDSLATLQIPAISHGIRYEFGIFEQRIRDGRQVELADKWLRLGNPWEIPRPEINFPIGFGGHTEHYCDDKGCHRVRWVPAQVVKGVAYDTPIPGYRVPTVNLLRLWSAQACEVFDFQAFNVGDYERAVEQKVASETISKVLYPNDELSQGKRLRLEQQYFFAACAMQDMIRIYHQRSQRIEDLAEKFTVQLNDTHPAVAVAELMRLLVDVYQMDWEPAWAMVCSLVSFTNHSLLPEALETWSVELFGSVLPRHLEIVYEINRRFLEDVRRVWPGDEARVARMSLIDETGGRRIRMAHLACVAAHKINGVAELHSRLLREKTLSDFYELDPSRFTNVTNGVTPRRFLALANPALTRLITETIGDGWLRDLARLKELETWADDRDFQLAWRSVKLRNKERLADEIQRQAGVVVDPASLFDIQAKRVHEYKRQQLNILHVISRYLRLRSDPGLKFPPRTWVFAGKAAPGYRLAKLIIELIEAVARVVNRDPAVSECMRVAFLPNFNVKNAQGIYPAADLSEQISTAGTEASGTGNMKFALNGALTIGSLDGANIEIRRAVDPSNFFAFGMTEAQASERRHVGYGAQEAYAADSDLRAALDAIAGGVFSVGDRDRFGPLLSSLLERDEYFVMGDFTAYVARQQDVDRLWSDPASWTRRSILNTARCGCFSSDRAVGEYCSKIWHINPVEVEYTAERLVNADRSPTTG
jgi:starch phosphorylase